MYICKVIKQFLQLKFDKTSVNMFILNLTLLGLFVSLAARSLDQGGTAPGELSKKKCQEYSRTVSQPNQCAATYFDEAEFAREHEFPHMIMLGVLIDEKINLFCGGSLISEQFVLVPANCLARGAPDIVRAGITSLNDIEHAQDIKIKEIMVHPEYKPPTAYNDIGLVKLEKKFNLTDKVRPACLHTQRDIEEELAISSLWGPGKTGAEDRLQRNTLGFYDQEKCNESFEPIIGSKRLRKGITYDTMICAGSNSTERALRGGGPLQLFHKEYPCMYDIIGITSFGKPTDSSTVFTRVSAYIPWIEEQVWK